MISIILLNIRKSYTESNLVNSVNSDVWTLPSISLLKFNVDGSARMSPRLVGIRGVLRDCYRKVMCPFSSFIKTQDFNTVEIMAIHKACELCISNKALVDWDFVIVSDLKVAISRVNSDDFGSLKHVNIVYDIHSMASSSGNITLVFNQRSTNSFMDMLALGRWKIFEKLITRAETAKIWEDEADAERE